ncbi:glycogenin-2-like isoform X5 [Ostrinia nubilalis]|uniref:glycogenin-2-like isoform X5 n=1 Tax=Ostrinia nubilalis TaxID=29057 RepID=UPI0030825DE1
MSNRAWVTLATNDSYGLGALVLAHSLRRATSAYPAVVLITPSVTDAMRERLRAVFADVVIVDVLDSKDAAHLALLQRPELGITFTKIHCWSLTQYEKCVFLDADTLVIQNCDELFEREELSAAPDVGWPDCFNSGVFVYKPSNETFEKLIKFAQERGSFDGGDQGLLNSFFSDWAHGDINKHLPFLYNVTSAAFYSYLPALKHYGQDLKIIHFIGIAKPWLQQFNWESRTVDAPDHLKGLLQLWWDLFVGQVHSQLDVTMSGVAGNLARVIPGASGSQREALDELTRRQGWEAGNIDYMGADSFDNIWAKISQTLSQPRVSPPKQLPKEPSPPKQEAPAPAPVEVAQEAATVDAPAPEAAPAPVAAPETAVEAPAKEPAPEAVEAPVTSQAAAPVEAPAPADVPVTVEAAPKEAAEPVAAAEIPATVEAVAADAPAPVDSSDIPATVEAASAPGEAPKSTEAPPEVPVSVETPVASEVAKDEPQKTETPALPPTPPVTPKSAPEAQKEVSVPAAEPASESAPQVESVETPKEEVPVPASEPVSESAPKVESVEPKKEAAPASEPASESAPKVETPKVEAPVSVESVPKVESQKDEISPASEGAPKVESVESPKEEAPAPVEAPQAPVAPATPVSSAPASPAKPPATPEKPLAPPSPTASTDSPPLANTPSKEEAPALPAAKSEERRKVGKLQLRPPAVADPLPTPDSELEDAATLAHAIIASELRTPTVSPPEPAAAASPPPPLQEKRLSVEGPEVPTPPISLAQIGVKPAPKAKPTTAAQIESSLADKSEPAATADQPAPKKKVVKKVKKETTAAGGEAPVPPPRKKEKKPKEK